MDIITGIALSLHIGLELDYNSIHPFVMGEYNNFIGGVYLNSENNISPFLGYRFDLSENFSFDIAAVSGYSVYNVLPMLRLNYNIDQKTTLFIAPAIESFNNKLNTGIVLGIQNSK